MRARACACGCDSKTPWILLVRTPFELAKVMGTRVAMIERHYGALIGGAHAGITGRLDRLEAEPERAAASEAGRLGHE
jgi:hypothetical protein